MKTSLITATLALAAITAILALSSCTLTVSPDGSRTYSTDGAAIAKIIIESAK